MEILAAIGIIAAFAVVCAAIYRVGRSLQRNGHDLNFVDPRYPDSMQAAPGNRDVTPPGRPYPERLQLSSSRQFPVDGLGTHLSQQFVRATERTRAEESPRRRQW
jgi:hypothetical protein